MKKSKDGFKCVYAGPPIEDELGAEEKPKDDCGSDGEKPPYPNSFLEDDEHPEPRMLMVYAGPEMMKMRSKLNEPIMQAVYACPPMPPVSDNPPVPPMNSRARMRHVYAAPMPKSSDAEMNEVYAGPEIMENQPPFAQMMTFCPKCGSASQPSFNFCSNCGAKLRNTDAEDENGEAQAKMPDKPQSIRKGFFARPKGNRDELV